MRFLLFVAMVGCGGGVQVLERTAQTESIAIRGSDENAHGTADRYMKSHCAAGYTLLDERPITNGWCMTYRCNGAGDYASEARIESVTFFLR